MTPPFFSISYAVGDLILQHCFGSPSHARLVRVTEKHDDVKNGRPGFSGVTPGGMTVWGYDSDVAEIREKAKLVLP